MTKAILLDAHSHARVASQAYEDWCGGEYVPERSRTPGFLTASRWVNVDDPNVSVTLFDLESAAVLASPEFRAASEDRGSERTRRILDATQTLLHFEGTQTLPGDLVSPSKAGALLVNSMSAAPEGEAEFNRWYDEEHIPALAAVPGTLAARRFVASRTSRQKYLALYHLESPEVVLTAAWAKAVETPWTRSIRPYMQDRFRIVCRAHPGTL
jgi:hypothetical protein